MCTAVAGNTATAPQQEAADAAAASQIASILSSSPLLLSPPDLPLPLSFLLLCFF